jgi:hypothetical protein
MENLVSQKSTLTDKFRCVRVRSRLRVYPLDFLSNGTGSVF